MVSKPLHNLSNLVQTLVGLLTIHVVTHRWAQYEKYELAKK
jgi:hypothetical protein